MGDSLLPTLIAESVTRDSHSQSGLPHSQLLVYPILRCMTLLYWRALLIKFGVPYNRISPILNICTSFASHMPYVFGCTWYLGLLLPNMVSYGPYFLYHEFLKFLTI